MSVTPDYIAGYVDGFAVGFVRARLGRSFSDESCLVCGASTARALYRDGIFCHRCASLVAGDTTARHSLDLRRHAVSGAGVPPPAILEAYGQARLQEVYAAKRRLPR